MLAAALALVIERRMALLRATALPIAALVLVGIAMQSVQSALPAELDPNVPPDPAAARASSQLLLLMLVQLALVAKLAVATHRVIYLGPGGVSSGVLQPWGRRELRYIAKAFVVGIVGMAAAVPYLIVTSGAAGAGSGAVLGLIVVAPLLYVPSRIALILPAAAVDHPLDIGGAWVMSGGNGWRMVIIVFAVPFVVTLPLAWIAARIAYPFSLLLDVLAFACTWFSLAALTLAYSELARPASPRGMSTAET